jgi:hypothetical protein
VKYTEDEQKVLSLIDELVKKKNMIERQGDDFKKLKRSGKYINACELYRDHKTGLDERQALSLLNALVEKKALHIDNLHYYL